MVEKSTQQKVKAKTSAIQATGRRKESVARVFLREGSGKFKVNNRSLEDYFPRESHRLIIGKPVKIVNLENKVDVAAIVDGGGVTGQAHALRLGISRAIVKMDPEKRSPLKKEGLLTRDPRAKERKKYGRKRARKRFQYSKR